MTLQTLKIGRREFVLLARRDFERLAAQAQRQTEDEYWTDSALQAEAEAKARKEKPIAFSEVERELNARQKSALALIVSSTGSRQSGFASWSSG